MTKLQKSNRYILYRKVIVNYNNISFYYCFLLYFYQINAALVRIRDVFKTLNIKSIRTCNWSKILVNINIYVGCVCAHACVYWCMFVQCPPLILAPLINMSKGGCENKSALFILWSFTQKIHKILTYHWSKTIESGEKISWWNKCFSPMNVGHNYWHP